MNSQNMRSIIKLCGWLQLDLVLWLIIKDQIKLIRFNCYIRFLGQTHITQWEKSSTPSLSYWHPSLGIKGTTSSWKWYADLNFFWFYIRLYSLLFFQTSIFVFWWTWEHGMKGYSNNKIGHWWHCRIVAEYKHKQQMFLNYKNFIDFSENFFLLHLQDFCNPTILISNPI